MKFLIPVVYLFKEKKFLPRLLYRKESKVYIVNKRF